ncbi:tail fiber/spike domain-containing protein [Klebsiella quasipneumoniae]|uniref:tail fiber/spike domain-containing protein n=1 Tax=Klebsiella quasipneumoniae TaxID=1463165 RepID=UPI0021ABFA48|nr:hypothetical protein [Klebsiella quasipneumoniae]UVG20772.1 hypothetical protein NWT75_24570 [Klebsiella quasipneumoniae]
MAILITGKSMTRLPESSSWEEEIELISRSERVAGGLDGPANRPLKSLANRTRYLKDQADTADESIAEKVSAVKTFAEGATLESPREEILFDSYRLVWTGAFPKTVLAGSTPQGTGGIGAGCWAYTSDAVIRQSLGSGEPGLGSDISAFVERVNVATPYLKTVSDILNMEPVNALRAIPKTLHSAIYDGTSEVDVSAYVNAMAQAVSGAGTEKRGRLIVPHGRLALAAPLTLYRQLEIVGAGAHATELFLLPGSNCDIIKSENFDVLTDTGYTTDNALVPSWMGLKLLRINGNRSNNESGNGVSLYGPRLNFDELLVMQCAGNGLYTEYSDLFGSDDWVGQEEGRIGTVISRNNGARGWHYRGPHNTVANNIICAYNDDFGFYNETLAGKYDGNITSLENLHTYANANGAGDRGSYFGSVTSIGYLIIDGDYCEIAAIGCQISKIKGIFLGQSNSGLIISGSRTNIGEMSMSMHSTALGQSLVNITGNDNKIGALYATSEAAAGLNDGVIISGFTNNINNLTVGECRNGLVVSGGGNKVKGTLKRSTASGLVYATPTDTYSGRNELDLLINQSAGAYVSGDRPVDQLDKFSITALGFGSKATEADLQSAAIALDSTTAQTLTIAHRLLYTPTVKSISLAFSSSAAVAQAYDMHVVGADSENITVYFKMTVAATAGATGRVNAKVKI